MTGAFLLLEAKMDERSALVAGGVAVTFEHAGFVGLVVWHLAAAPQIEAS